MDWLPQLIDFGTPLIVLILLIRILMQAAYWVAQHLVLPIRDSWINHLQVLDEHMQQQTRMLCEILERVGDAQA